MPSEVDYVDWREERAPLPPLRQRVRKVAGRLVLALACALLVMACLIAVIAGTGGSQQVEVTVVSDGGLLADVRGEDRLYRLESTQAALGREMELFRRWLSGNHEGEFPSPAETELARSLAELEARYSMLLGEMALLEARQRQMEVYQGMWRMEGVQGTLPEPVGEVHLLEEGS